MRKIIFISMVLIVTSTIISCTDCKKTSKELLSSTEWTLTGMSVDSVNFEERIINNIEGEATTITIIFSDSTTFAGNGSCNQYFGTFTTEDDDKIAIETRGRTMMMCPNIEFEDIYINALNGVGAFVAEENLLILTNPKTGSSLTFTPSKNMSKKQ